MIGVRRVKVDVRPSGPSLAWTPSLCCPNTGLFLDQLLLSTRCAYAFDAQKQEMSDKLTVLKVVQREWRL